MMQVREARQTWASGLILAGLAAVCTALVAITHTATAPRIAANAQAYLEKSLEPVLQGVEYDGNLSESTIYLSPPHGLPGNEDVPIYRVYADGSPVAALFVVKAMDGFAGPIRLLIGIDANGVITGVRVLEHRETPGLGDLIDIDKSNWIEQFTGKSLVAPLPPLWAIKRDGGEFDQFTGASITPRSVINAVRQTLDYFAGNREQVFAATQESEPQ
jgi:electron transport complex protein RnfG